MVILFLCSSFLVLISNTASYSNYTSVDAQSNQLPYNDFYLHYQLKAKKDTLPLFNIDMNISYNLLTVNTSNSYD